MCTNFGNFQEIAAQIIFLRQPLLDICFVPHNESTIIGCNSKSLPDFLNIKTGKGVKLHISDDLKTHQVVCKAIHSRR